MKCDSGVTWCDGCGPDNCPHGSDEVCRNAAAVLGETWLAFGMHEGRLIALPEYAAATAQAVGEKIMETARREGFKGSLRERMDYLGWSVRRVVLAPDSFGVKYEIARHGLGVNSAPKGQQP